LFGSSCIKATFLTLRHAHAYAEVELYVHAFFISPLDQCEWYFSIYGRFSPW